MKLADRYPLRRPLRPASVAIHVAAALGCCAAQAAVTAFATSLLSPGVANVGDIFVYWFMILTPAGVIVYAAVAAIRTAQRNGREARDRAEEARLLARQLTEAQLLALRSQLRPHFLFNTLNAVLTLVRDGDNPRAAEAITSLAALLRSTLQGDGRHVVPLHEELRFIQDYLRLEGLRHDERLGVSVEVPAALLHMPVPSLVLQPLVENALKHGVARVPYRVEVQIVAQAVDGCMLLRVADTGAGVTETPGMYPGVGLANLRSRLEQLYPGHGRVELRANPTGAGAVAEVSIPMPKVAA